jgi:hypothetical protein
MACAKFTKPVTDPTSVRCDLCGAEAGAECRTSGDQLLHNNTRWHAARWKQLVAEMYREICRLRNNARPSAP